MEKKNDYLKLIKIEISILNFFIILARKYEYESERFSSILFN